MGHQTTFKTCVNCKQITIITNALNKAIKTSNCNCDKGINTIYKAIAKKAFIDEWDAIKFGSTRNKFDKDKKDARTFIAKGNAILKVIHKAEHSEEQTRIIIDYIKQL